MNLENPDWDLELKEKLKDANTNSSTSQT